MNELRRLLLPAGITARIASLTLRPVIIGGCGRSGTTLLLSVLSCHPNLLTIPHETEAFCPGGYQIPPTLEAPFDVASIQRWLSDQPLSDVHLKVCEKTPRNVLYFGRLLRAFESVRLVHMVRDGRDVVTSRHPRDPSRDWVTPSRWVHDVSHGAAVEEDPRVHVVRYEDLIREPESTLRSLCDYIEVPFDGRLLSYPDAARITHSEAWFRQARPLSCDSIGRWRRPEHATRVTALEQTPDAARWLSRYGYV